MRKFKLSYDKNLKYWFKNIKIEKKRWKKLYLCPAKNKYQDIESYNKALGLYDEWLNGDLEKPISPDDMYNPGIREKTIIENRPHRRGSRRPVDTIEGQIDKYIADKISRHNKSTPCTIPAGITWAYQCFNNEFLRGNKNKRADGLRDIKFLTGMKLRHYSTFLTNQKVAKGEWNISTARKNITQMKSFLYWYYDNTEGVGADILKGIKSTSIGGLITRPKIEIYTRLEIAALYEIATDRMKLYILLGLNCGFQAADIGSLQYHNIIFDDDIPVRIRKMRTKSGEHGSWVLWKLTSLAIKKHLDENKPEEGWDEDSLICLGMTGNPITRAIRKIQTNSKTGYIEHKYYVTDGIGKSFSVCRNTANEKRTDKILLSFKHFRKTGVSWISRQALVDNQANIFLIESQYLTHRVPTMAREHYVEKDYELLDSYLKKIEQSHINPTLQG